MLTLVLGGARSGKTRQSQLLAAATGRSVVYVATGQAGDGEMAARIARHRAERPADWGLVEAPREVAAAVAAQPAGSVTVIVDCLGFMVSNWLCAPGAGSQAGSDDGVRAAVLDEVGRLITAASAAGARIIVVSNEVGQGLVPEYPLGRAFRDLLGEANQLLAAAADVVYYQVAGIPVMIKGPASS